VNDIVRRRVVMSGYPGSGKSTLAAALADRLGFTLVCKDAMLMTLYSAFEFGPGDAAASLRTGRAAWAVFWLQAGLSPRAVLDTNISWADPQAMERLRSLPGEIVELRCDCPPETAQARYAERARIGHAAQRLTQLTADRLEAYGRPLGVGQLVTVDTRETVDVAGIEREVRIRLQI